jgi:2-keto-4-pentenoate hydratase/2-oxohepta-3-ene-1,7-dioic acid hydratase in catechol pathway
MQYCRFRNDNGVFYGLIDGQAITRILPRAPRAFSDFDSGEKADLPLSEVHLLAPVEPSKIVCVGRNYRERAKELNHAVPTEPLLFFKPPSSIIGPGDGIQRPADLSERVDYEGELGVIVAKRCSRLREGDDVRPYILGYTCVNDVTARDLQSKDNQWARAKGFDTFCPVGPVVANKLDPWRGVRVQTRVNGEVRQDGVTSDFLFPLDVLFRHITAAMTLEAGDLIATGTPQGVGPLQAGDVVEVSVDGVGKLTNPVMDRE